MTPTSPAAHAFDVPAERHLEDLDVTDVEAIATHLYRPSPWALLSFVVTGAVAWAVYVNVERAMVAWTVMAALVFYGWSYGNMFVRLLKRRHLLRDELGLADADAKALARVLRWSKQRTVFGGIGADERRRVRELIATARARR